MPICLYRRVSDSIKISLPVTEIPGTGNVKQKESKRQLSELVREYFLCKAHEVPHGKILLISGCFERDYSPFHGFWQSFISIEVCRDCIPTLA